MTSRNWKDQREKQAFLQQLREFRDETLLSQDLDQECESFDDSMDDSWTGDDGDLDDLDELYYDADHMEDDWEPKSSIFDIRDDWDSDLTKSHRCRSGDHIRTHDGEIWLVLDNGRWANLLTGRVIVGAGWVDKESIVFGDD